MARASTSKRNWSATWSSGDISRRYLLERVAAEHRRPRPGHRRVHLGRWRAWRRLVGGSVRLGFGSRAIGVGVAYPQHLARGPAQHPQLDRLPGRRGLVPLAIIFVVAGLGSRDELDRISLVALARQLRRAFDPIFLPTFLNSLRYAAIHDRPVPRHRLPDRALDLPVQRAAQGAATDPGDAPVLVQLPHPDVLLDDHLARQRGGELDPSGKSGLIQDRS